MKVVLVFVALITLGLVAACGGAFQRRHLVLSLGQIH